MSRTPAKITQWHRKEARILEGINAAYWFVAIGERKLAKHRGEMTTMTLADIIPL